MTFKIEVYGPGTLLHYADGQTPLRALRWLAPLPGGIQAVQVLTQSDRQRLVLFQNGAMIANLLVPRPTGVREGFFNFAELREAIVLPGDVAVLLYRSTDASSGEMPLVIAMDLATQATRWVHRAPGEHFALGRDANSGCVFLFGPTAILRLPLALQKGERIGEMPFRVGLKPIELPEEIKTPSDLLPTGPWSFLLAHGGGLSSYSENRGWKHWPTPSEAPSSSLTPTPPSPKPRDTGGSPSLEEFSRSRPMAPCGLFRCHDAGTRRTLVEGWSPPQAPRSRSLRKSLVLPGGACFALLPCDPRGSRRRFGTPRKSMEA